MEYTAKKRLKRFCTTPPLHGRPPNSHDALTESRFSLARISVTCSESARPFTCFLSPSLSLCTAGEEEERGGRGVTREEKREGIRLFPLPPPITCFPLRAIKTTRSRGEEGVLAYSCFPEKWLISKLLTVTSVIIINN